MDQSATKSESKETLNWKRYLSNENTLIDVLKFKNWDKNLKIPEADTLVKDLTRTRFDDPYFKKEKVQKELQLIATFYCQQNNVNYQQGMLEIVIPFLLLKNCDFSLPKCYAYFNAFMNQYFPRVLQQKVINNTKELPYALSAIHFSEILFKYHSAQLYEKLTQIPEFSMSMVVTQWIMTLFAKGTQITIVFLIFDHFMKRRNPNYIFYLTIALFKMKEQQIEDLLHSERLLIFLNKDLKTITTETEVEEWFRTADGLMQNTPLSFEKLIEMSAFHDNTVLSVEDIRELVNIQNQQNSKYIFILGADIIEMIQDKQEQKLPDRKNGSQLSITNNKCPAVPYILDVSPKRDKRIREIIPSSMLIKAKYNPKKKEEFFKKVFQQLQTNKHLCLIGQNIEQSISVADLFIHKGRNYISVFNGGVEDFKGLFKLVKSDSKCQIM